MPTIVSSRFESKPTITGINDAPAVSANFSSTTTEECPGYTIDLLQPASDAEHNDVLSVANLTLTGDDRGIVVSGSSLEVDPSGTSQRRQFACQAEFHFPSIRSTICSPR